MRILAISGSLRARSSNTSAIEAVARLAPAGVTISRCTVLAELPHFNPDLDTETSPPIVSAFRAQIGASDGLMISSPEYTHGVPGVMKNALDWLVGSLEFAGTPVALINASPHATFSDPQLREILVTMAARLVENACITLPLAGRGLDAQGIAEDPELAPMLASAVRAFVAGIREVRATAC